MSGRHTKSKTSFPVTPIPVVETELSVKHKATINWLTDLPLCTDVSRREDRGNLDLTHRTSGPPDPCLQRLWKTLYCIVLEITMLKSS